ncbi:MAG TPA: Ig-like domain-containing protein, partial [Gemmatimonadota bacterium]|nr:Ig-like domain-containing protein [Gemmatimonadota bacterium]
MIRASAPHPLSVSAAVSLALLLTLFAASPVRAQLGVDGEITADPTAIRANGSDTSTITVQAKDTLGTNLLVGGDSVRMSTTAGTFPGPCTSSCLATDNGNGTYTSILTSSTSWGTATVSGTINDSLMNGEAQVSFTATALQFGVDPEDTAAGATITPAVTVRAVDGAGNTVSTFNGSITVALGNNPGGDGTLSGTKTRAAVNGVATFNDLSIDKADTGYTLTAAASGLTGDTSASFNITAGPAVALRFVQQPTNEQAGTAISPAVTVRAVDSGGNTDLNFTGNITVALGNNPGGDGTLSGTKTRAAVNGVATFNDLSIDKADTGYTLTAAASGLTGDTSASF